LAKRPWQHVHGPNSWATSVAHSATSFILGGLSKAADLWPSQAAASEPETPAGHPGRASVIPRVSDGQFRELIWEWVKTIQNQYNFGYMLEEYTSSCTSYDFG